MVLSTSESPITPRAHQSNQRGGSDEIVAIDPSAAFRKALRTWLPRAAVSVDKFHLVKLGNDMVTTVRQRLARTHRGRRGRKDDPAWAHRMLLLRGGDTLTPRAWSGERVFRTDDPTDELSASWGIKEQLRRLLATDTSPRPGRSGCGWATSSRSQHARGHEALRHRRTW